ncbi:MAG: hypothetical protein LBT86_01390 [Deltaproteobacteria bacterium]|jgi:hypothetical protein|nr:hypothetical protein [Deltaproteobacteria bacterium]
MAKDNKIPGEGKADGKADGKEKSGPIYGHRFDFVCKKVNSTHLQIGLDLAEIPSGLTGKMVSSELPDITVSIPRSDSIIKLSDKSYLITEFQFKAVSKNLYRFIKYGIFLAESIFLKEKVHRLIRIVVFYPAGVKIPTYTFTVSGTIKIQFIQISLGDKIDGKKLLDTIKEKLKDPDKQATEAVSADDLALLYLAPFGYISIPKKEFETDYLTLGAQLSKIFNDRSIFATMMVAIADAETRRPFEEEFKLMYQEDLLDYLSGGEYSKALASTATATAIIKAKDKELKKKDKEIKTQGEALKTQGEELVTSQQQIKTGVLSLSAKGFSNKEISDTLSLSEDKVAKILKESGKH